MFEELQSMLGKMNKKGDKMLHQINSAGLIDKCVIEEIQILKKHENVTFYFGKSLMDLKCLLIDDEGKHHQIIIKCIGQNKFRITQVDLPHSSFLNNNYTSLKEILTAFKEYLKNLTAYIYQLEHIDRFCIVVQPIKPSLKEDYRRIVLDNRTWLHFEVTQEGLAKNIHLIGDADEWYDKLQNKILNWNHDVGILENITNLFDFIKMPQSPDQAISSHNENITEELVCNICLCSTLTDEIGVPQPLCQNAQCGIYFHRMCLFQWLLTCANGRPPTLGVASGNCPSCFHPILCHEKDG